GPTEEFCPDDACWRIRAERREYEEDRAGKWVTAGRPWMLEPDPGHLRELLLTAVADAERRAGRPPAAACPDRAGAARARPGPHPPPGDARLAGGRPPRRAARRLGRRGAPRHGRVPLPARRSAQCARRGGLHPARPRR